MSRGILALTNFYSHSQERENVLVADKLVTTLVQVYIKIVQLLVIHFVQNNTEEDLSHKLEICVVFVCKRLRQKYRCASLIQRHKF